MLYVMCEQWSATYPLGGPLGQDCAVHPGALWWRPLWRRSRAPGPHDRVTLHGWLGLVLIHDPQLCSPRTAAFCLGCGKLGEDPVRNEVSARDKYTYITEQVMRDQCGRQCFVRTSVTSWIEPGALAILLFSPPPLRASSGPMASRTCSSAI